MWTERAPAKLNLTLEIKGRRGDGYHELSSLVAFASCGDTLSVAPAASFTLTVSGPFAGALGSDNLVARVVAAATAIEPRLTTGTFHLEKNLPVAAGLGGGSSDAAAAIRLVRRLNPDRETAIDWPRLALEIGADVPVCLEGRAAHMTGLGERVVPVTSFPRLWAVLANPGVPLSTAAVFGELAAGAAPPEVRLVANPQFGDAGAVLAYVAASRNDLEAPARRLCPVVGEVLAALAAVPNVAVTRMSGSGATCFGLFVSQSDAVAGAHRLSTRHPAWWVVATELS
jgi:4-diphosphocytidyl-2-C-methyl-D-erythritol kinase